MYLHELYPGPTIQSRSAARRGAQDLVMIMKRAMRIPALLAINSTGIISLGNLFSLGLKVKVDAII